VGGPALLLAVALVAGPFGAAGAEGGGAFASFDYLYVEANEGGSSGGHAALRLGDHVYHFENQGGLLVLDREPTPEFLHAYTLLGNRTIELSRVALLPADRDRIAARLEQRRRLQALQLDVEAALGEDRRLLEAWRKSTAGNAPPEAAIAVPALGYFAGSAEPADAEPDDGRAGRGRALVARLREQISRRHGASFLAERRAQATRALDDALAADPSGWTVRTPQSADDVPAFAQSFSRRIQDAASSLAALDVLEGTTPLAPSATIALEGPSGWLSAAELDVQAARRRALEHELLRLARSRRVDWGRPLLVALARLLAAAESEAAGRLVVLDALPRDAARIPARVLEARPDGVAEIRRAAADRVEEARAALLPRSGGESNRQRAWSELEASVSRLHELTSATRERRDLRIARGILVPARPGELVLPLPPPLEQDALEASLAQVHAREVRYRDALEDLYRYRLVARNCVSELFHSVNAALGGSPESVRTALGGYVDGRSSLQFIPFVSARAVDAHYRVVGHRRLPSYRELRLQEMRERESAWWVALRESNTLTARSYRRGHRDSFFLFFTDSDAGGAAVALRPFLGALNLAAALGESLWGVLRLPADGGDTFQAGLEGALASLPELAFWNIRKGSNDWVGPQPHALDDGQPLGD
jgi:hypothetical protein